ncbi:MAG TPA: glycosyltransferase 87 family protein [bacterium]
MTRLDEFAGKPKVLAIAAFLSIGIVFLQAWFSLLTIDRTKDSYSYYYAAKAIGLGLDPYDVEELRHIGRMDGMYDGIGPYVYPPPFAGFWRCLTWMSASDVHSVLILLGTILFGLGLWILSKTVKPPRHPFALLFLFLLYQVLNGPAVTSLRMGQITPLITVLILACLYAHLRNRENLSTLFLAIAIIIKIAPAVLLIYFFLFYPRRWQYLAKVGIWLLLLVLATLPLASPAAWQDYFQSSSSGLPLKAPYSVWGWLQLHTLPVLILENNKPLIYLLICLPLTILTVLGIKNQRPTEQAPYAFSMLAMLSLVIAPLTWHQHFYIWLLPGFYFTAYHWGRQNYGRACIWAFLIFIVMTRVPEPFLMLRPAGTLFAMLLELRLTPPRIEVA